VHNELEFVLQALADLGVRVSEEASIVAVSALETARQLSPAVTSVAMPIEELGARAGELVVEVVAGRTPESTLLQPELAMGASSARCPTKSAREIGY
jgi:LacI family transcriptional regulator